MTSGVGSSNGGDVSSPSPWRSSWPPEALTMARTALDVTRQDWGLTGQTVAARESSAPMASSSVAAAALGLGGGGGSGGLGAKSHNCYRHPLLSEMGNEAGTAEIVERIVSLLLIRIVALVTCRLGMDGAGTGGASRRTSVYSDYSTTTMCRVALRLVGDADADRRGSPEATDVLDGALAQTSLVRHSSEPVDKMHVYNSYNQGRSNDVMPRLRNLSLPATLPPPPLFPSQITPEVIHQLRQYVTVICSQYKTPDVIPYHNVEHAYHVFLSANKLLDLMLCEQPEGSKEGGDDESLHRRGSRRSSGNNEEEHEDGVGNNDGSGGTMRGSTQTTGSSGTMRGSTQTTGSSDTVKRSTRRRRNTVDSAEGCAMYDHGIGNRDDGGVVGSKRKIRPTFGLKSDPLSQLAFLFSALVHDVDHTGISNRQLVLEMDDLAILYNDQSVAEQRSLAVAFSTLKRPEYRDLREVLFPSQERGAAEASVSSPGVGAGALGNEDFFKFRKLVIDLVLVTDIASPERTQIVKSKWKEAFGEAILSEKLMKKGTSMRNLAVGGGLSKRMASASGGRRRGSIDRGREYYRIQRRASLELDPTAEEERQSSDPDKSGTDDNKGPPASNERRSRKDGQGGETSNGKAVAIKLLPTNLKPTELVPTRRKQVERGTTSSDSLNEDSPSARGSNKGGELKKDSDHGSSSQSLERRRKRQTSVGGGSNNRSWEKLKNSSFRSTDMSDSFRDADSIDFSSDSSESPSSISSMHSIEDDFNTSAVSRTKMNFDLRNLNGSSQSMLNNSEHSGTNSSEKRRQQQQQHARSATAQRWSTGDIADDADDLEEGKLKGEEGGHVRGRSRGNEEWRNHETAAASHGGTTTTATSNNIGKQAASSAADPLANPRRRRSGFARNQRGGLSQSMLNPNELRLLRPRAHSEERRLGVRRALDLAGSTIIAYNTGPPASLRGSSNSRDGEPIAAGKNASGGGSGASDTAPGAGGGGGVGGGPGGEIYFDNLFDPDDDVDELKATVVLEQMIRAADVGALLQDWENSTKWATRLYKELKNGYLCNRGEDPSVGWYENQIKFLDFYILPLAKNLGAMGVFEERMGAKFVHHVKSNMARWIEEGGRATELMMREDEEERCQKRQQQSDERMEDLMQSVGSCSLHKNEGSDPSDHSLPSPPAAQRDSLTSSFKSNCSASSQGESSTNRGNSNRKQRSSRRKLIASNSMEVGESCVMCGVIGRFSCRICAAPYCSAKCCREHKASGCQPTMNYPRV